MNAKLVHCLLNCLLLCAALTGAARGAEELPKSSACHTALQALEEAEDAIAASAAASAPADRQHRLSVAARLQPLRQRVADACLGGMTASPPPSRHSAVAAPAPRPDSMVPRGPMPATPPVPVAPPRFDMPATVTHCTAAVCFASDGSTLTRVGPSLVGPRGTCTVQGGFVRCP